MSAVALTVLMSSAASTAELWEINLSPYQDFYGGETIEVPPGDIETLYIHIDADPPGSEWYVEYTPEFHWLPVDPGTGTVTVLDWYVHTGEWLEASTWYPYVRIQVDGPASSYIDMYGIVPIYDVGDVMTGSVIKHITPEPSSLLAMGTGVLGIGGLLLRRRRS